MPTPRVTDRREWKWHQTGALQAHETGELIFVKTSQLTIDAFETSDHETQEEYRVTWREISDGGDITVEVQKIERNDARPGKPDYWVPDVLSRAEIVKLERAIAQQLVGERKEENDGISWAEAVGPTEFWGMRA